MLRSVVASCYFKRTDFLNRIAQGDIFSDIDVQIHSLSTDTELETVTLHLPYAVVLTQDCDLFQDYSTRADVEAKNHDKRLQTVLLAPAYLATPFRQGEHLLEIDMQMEPKSSEPWKKIAQQNDARYHHLKPCPLNTVPELVIDFKHYYSISRDALSRESSKRYITTLDELFREQLSQRFAAYLSRIAMPDVKLPQSTDDSSIATS